MYQFSYSEVLADSTVDTRAQERYALDHAIGLLVAAQGTAPGSPAEQEALRFTCELWALFIKDLAQPDNDLEGGTRAGLMSIGLWVLRAAGRIQAGEARDFASIADICGKIRDGLA